MQDARAFLFLFFIGMIKIQSVIHIMMITLYYQTMSLFEIHLFC